MLQDWPQVGVDTLSECKKQVHLYFDNYCTKFLRCCAIDSSAIHNQISKLEPLSFLLLGIQIILPCRLKNIGISALRSIYNWYQEGLPKVFLRVPEYYNSRFNFELPKRRNGLVDTGSFWPGMRPIPALCVCFAF